MRTPPLLVLLLLATLVPTTSFTGSGQGAVQADLAVIGIEVLDAVYDAEEPATVRVTVQNHGPGNGRGTLHLRHNNTDRPLTGDARSDQPFNFTDPIPPGRNVTFEVAWAPTRAMTGNGTIIATVDGTFDNNGANDARTKAVHVARYRLQASLLDDTGHETFPGRWTPYRVSVRSISNAPVTFNATMLDDGPDGWRFLVPQHQHRLAPNKAIDLVVLARPPDAGSGTLPDGATGRASVHVAALENPRANTTATLPETVVQRAPDPAFTYGITVDVPSPWIAPSRTHTDTARLVLRNDGNVPTAFNLSARATGSLAPKVDLTLPRTTVALAPGEATNVTLVAALTQDATASEHANITIDVRSVNAALFEANAVASATIEVRAPGPDLTLEDVRVPAIAYRTAGIVTVDARVTNAGQEPANATTLSVRALRLGFPFAEHEVDVPALGPGKSAPLQVSIPIGELAGAYDLVVRVDPDDEVRENVEVNNDVTETLFVRTAGLRVLPAETLQATPGQFLRYEHPPHVFEVRNEGNARELVRVQVTSEHGWVEREELISITPGARRAVPISFLVPREPGTERDQLVVRASLVNLTSVSASNGTSTMVLDREPPVLIDITFPSNVTATQPFTVSTRWSDAVGVAKVTLQLRSPGNATQELMLDKRSAGHFAGNLTVFELGRYSFTMRAEDASAQANVLEDTAVHTFTATFERAPSVRFLAGEHERVLRAGTPIGVEVTDPSGVTRVTYVAGSETGVLNEPYEIATDAWPTGTIEVTVRAENRYGREGVTTANFTVDNEPPTLVDARLEPERPRPNEPFLLEARAEGGVRSLTVTLTGDAERSIVLDAQGERFAGEATLPRGRYTATFVAEDAAGNTASEELSFRVGERFLPGPGLWTLVALLAVAALVARRRGW